MIISQATLNDIFILAPLLDAYRVFYKQISDLKAAEIFLRERIQLNQSVIFICRENDRALGFTQLNPIFSSVSMKPAWLLNDLYVEASARKKGVAALLLNKAAEHGQFTGAAWLLLSTASDNFIAQSVYEKNGWNKLNDFFYELPLPDSSLAPSLQSH